MAWSIVGNVPTMLRRSRTSKVKVTWNEEKSLIVVRWIIVIGYISFIFWFARSTASSASSMTSYLLRWFPFLQQVGIQTVVYYLRKAIHVGGYFVAALLLYAAASVTPRMKKAPYFTAFGLSVALAVCDEWYQLSLPHRTGNPADVLVDLIGIALALIGIRLLNRRRIKEKASAN